MQPYTTDVGTLRLFETLTPAGREVLHGFLRRCEGARVSESASLGSIHFTRADIVGMTLEHDPSKGRKVLATTDFASGARWRRGSLRMPNVVLPDAMMAAIRGRMIEELVEGAPLDGYRIRHAVQDGRPGSPNGTRLRIRCDGEEQGEIPYAEPRRHAFPWQRRG